MTSLAEGLELRLVARDCEELRQATRFHFEMDGFPDEAAARQQGNGLRTRLQILNAALNLGLVIATEDITSARLSDEAKRQCLDAQGVTVIDSIVGVGVFPANGKHGELVVAGSGRVCAGDPEYVLTALKELWTHQYQFNERQTDALEILGRATAEVSPRTGFLLSYLALERVAEVAERSEAARNLLQAFIEQARSALPEEEATSLVGGLRSLSTGSVSGALRLLAKRLLEPQEIAGQPVGEFLNRCVRLRNRLAHEASTENPAELTEVSHHLRHLVLRLIWTQSKLPPFTVKVPPSKADFTNLNVRIM